VECIIVILIYDQNLLHNVMIVIIINKKISLLQAKLQEQVTLMLRLS